MQQLIQLFQAENLLKTSILCAVYLVHTGTNSSMLWYYGIPNTAYMCYSVEWYSLHLCGCFLPNNNMEKRNHIETFCKTAKCFRNKLKKYTHKHTKWLRFIYPLLSNAVTQHFTFHLSLLRDWSVSMNKRKLDSVISASLKTDSKPMDRDVAEEFSAETVHNSFTAQFMSKWLSAEKVSGHNWGIQRYIFSFLLQGWFINLKNVLFFFLHIGRFLT